MELKDLLAIIIIPLVLALIGIFWPELQRRWRGRSMENLILREISEIAPYPEVANQAGWWAHQKKQFVHRKIFDKPEDHIDFLLSLEPDMVYYVTQLWQSLGDQDWNQWKYALCELSKRYDDRLAMHKRRGKILDALEAWERLYELYACQGESLPLENSYYVA